MAYVKNDWVTNYQPSFFTSGVKKVTTVVVLIGISAMAASLFPNQYASLFGRIVKYCPPSVIGKIGGFTPPLNETVKGLMFSRGFAAILAGIFFRTIASYAELKAQYKADTGDLSAQLEEATKELKKNADAAPVPDLTEEVTRLTRLTGELRTANEKLQENADAAAKVPGADLTEEVASLRIKLQTVAEELQKSEKEVLSLQKKLGERDEAGMQLEVAKNTISEQQRMLANYGLQQGLISKAHQYAGDLGREYTQAACTVIRLKREAQEAQQAAQKKEKILTKNKTVQVQRLEEGLQAVEAAKEQETLRAAGLHKDLTEYVTLVDQNKNETQGKIQELEEENQTLKDNLNKAKVNETAIRHEWQTVFNEKEVQKLRLHQLESALKEKVGTLNSVPHIRTAIATEYHLIYEYIGNIKKLAGKKDRSIGQLEGAVTLFGDMASAKDVNPKTLDEQVDKVLGKATAISQSDVSDTVKDSLNNLIKAAQKIKERVGFLLQPS